VRIFGETIAVRAGVHTLGGFSAHAGQSDLLRWFGAMAGSKPRAVVCHGEDKARTIFAGLLRQRYGVETTLPTLGESVSL
jgi:metallo-beta-lactamase family protein